MAIDKTAKVDLIGKLLRIDNKQGVVVPFRFNKLQRYFHTHKGSRNVILKYRQGGCSSSILADQLTDCIIIPHTQCAVVSHEGRATQRLLDRANFFYKTMDDPKPELGAESRTELSFPGLHSSMYIGTAGARAFGHGDTIKKALLSELALYEDTDAERILNGVEDAVPMTGELTIECTAQGEENIFYEKYTKAREGKSSYKPFFFPWWWDDGYRLPRGNELSLHQDNDFLEYTDEEKFLVETHGLHEDQIRWRRWKIGEKGLLFHSQYPENDVDCWLIFGDPVFDQGILTDLANSCYDGDKHPEGWNFWLPPTEKVSYVIGADTASGAPEGSYSAAVVLDPLWRVCATFQARLEPNMFAGILGKLGRWYNNAELAIERNFTGYAVLEQLKNYPNVSHQRDFTTGKITSQRGWWTNDQTRSMLMTVTRENLATIKMWDSNLVRQLRGFRYVKLKSKYREEPQTHADLALAFMIAVTTRKVAGFAHGYQGSYNNWSW